MANIDVFIYLSVLFILYCISLSVLIVFNLVSSLSGGSIQHVFWRTVSRGMKHADSFTSLIFTRRSGRK